MTHGDTARILAKAAAFDQRTIGESDVLAWHEAIGDLDAADSLAAVARFYATVVDRRIMPGDVRVLAGEIQRERRRVSRLAIEAAEESPVDPRPLQDRGPEIRGFVGRVRSVLPEGDPDKLRYGTAYWRREVAIHRERDETPNPLFDPVMAAPVADWEASTGRPVRCWWQDEAARERHSVEELAKAGRLRHAPPEAS